MTTTSRAGSATIIQFPGRGAAPSRGRPQGQPTAPVRQAGAWAECGYHEAAVREETEARRRT